MSTIDRYIALAVARFYVLASVLLLALFAFLDLAEQLESVGEGGYELRNALLFTAYLLPRRLVDLTPFAVLLAGVLGLGGMAATHELVALRAAGVSPLRVAGSLLKAGAILLAAVIAIELFVAPRLYQGAYQMRAQALAGEAGDATTRLWTRWPAGALHIGQLRNGRIPAQIEIFRFGQDKELTSYIHAERAEILGAEHWLLHGVLQKTFAADGERSRRLPTLDWHHALSAAQLGIIDAPPESLSPIDLYRYVRYLQANSENAERFRSAFWQKLGLPLVAVAMMLLATPVAFSNPRGTGAGLRLILGGAIGLGVYIVNQIAINVGLLLDLSPALVALAPAGLLTVAALYGLRRLS